MILSSFYFRIISVIGSLKYKTKPTKQAMYVSEHITKYIRWNAGM